MLDQKIHVKEEVFDWIRKLFKTCSIVCRVLSLYCRLSSMKCSRLKWMHYFRLCCGWFNQQVSILPIKYIDASVINLIFIDEFSVIIIPFWAAQQTVCCSSTEFSSTVVNAFISCPTNTSCNAECYRGFIFPTGQTNQSFSCQKGVWTPMLSACKGKLFSFL